MHQLLTGVQIQDQQGQQLSKDQLLGAALTGAWQVGKSAACDQLAKRLTKPGDYSAYNVNCKLGSVVNVTSAEPAPNGFLLTADINGNEVDANYTQPFAGKWADPSVSMTFDARLTVQVTLAQDASCPGVSTPLPSFQFQDATVEIVNLNVNVNSTAADVVGAIAGFFSGVLFSGVGSVPGAISSALGTSAIIDGVAQAQAQVPQGAIAFTDAANQNLADGFSPCELTSSFGNLTGGFQTLSLSPNLVVLSVRNA